MRFFCLLFPDILDAELNLNKFGPTATQDNVAKSAQRTKITPPRNDRVDQAKIIVHRVGNIVLHGAKLTRQLRDENIGFIASLRGHHRDF